jgi:hypothetical protein
MNDDTKRAQLVEEVHQHLERAGRPRLVMFVVLAITLAAGFMASVTMVHLGVDRMSVRYPIAVAFAYATFLGMLWVWLLGQQVVDPELSKDPEGLLAPGAAAFGAVALGEKLAGEEMPPAKDSGKPKRGGWDFFSGGGGGGGGGDWGELGWLLIFVLIAGICTLIVSVYLIATSPLLLAELLVDGALLGGMSRAMSPEPPPHWSRAVVRRTWLAALITAVVFGLVGFGIESVAPGAHTLGEAWSHAKDR